MLYESTFFAGTFNGGVLAASSGVLMGVLAVAGIPFGKWLKFVAPLIAVWMAICVVVLIIGVEIKWGPF